MVNKNINLQLHTRSFRVGDLLLLQVGIAENLPGFLK